MRGKGNKEGQQRDMRAARPGGCGVREWHTRLPPLWECGAAMVEWNATAAPPIMGVLQHFALEGPPMSVTCLISHTANDLRCPVCGQGFLLFPAGRVPATAREQIRRCVQGTMRAHHSSQTSGAEAHPGEAFVVERENGNFDDPRLFGVPCGA